MRAGPVAGLGATLNPEPFITISPESSQASIKYLGPIDPGPWTLVPVVPSDRP